MKILFSIYSKAGTPGGHFFSLEHLVHALYDRGIEIVVVCIGYETPKVIQDLPFEVYQITPHVTQRKEIKLLLQKINPDVIHCFDARSYIVLSYYALWNRYRFILTKAGGGSPHNGFPYCGYYILFSEENYDTFKKRSRYKDSQIYLISNRVNKKLLHQHPQETNSKFTFLQIVRFTTAKHKQILQSLNFIKRLYDEGEDVKFILAGTVNDKEEKNFIEKFIIENKLFDVVSTITDSRVERGSDLLCLGDCVIGMGRSVMEAAALGKVVVVPNSKSNYPLLLDNENFQALYKYNFSGRSKIVVGEKEFSKIKSIIKNSEYRSKISNYTAIISREYFELTEDKISKYIDIYESLKRIAPLKNLLKNIVIYAKFFIKGNV